MTHIYYDPSNDEVYNLIDGWFCEVDRKEYGPYNSKGAALAGMKVEQARAEKRALKHAEDAA